MKFHELKKYQVLFLIILLPIGMIFISSRCTPTQLDTEKKTNIQQDSYSLDALAYGNTESKRNHLLDSLFNIHKGDSSHADFLHAEYIKAVYDFEQIAYDEAINRLINITENPEVSNHPRLYLKVIIKLLKCFDATSNYLEVLDWINTGDECVASIDNTTLKNKYLALKASLLRSLGRYDESLELAYSIEKSLVELNAEPEDLIYTYNTLALILMDLNEFDSSLEYGIKAQKLIESVENKLDDTFVSSTYNNLSIAYKGLEMYNEAIDAIEKSISINNQQPSTRTPQVVKNYYNLGTFYLDIDSTHEEALKNFKLGLKKSTDKDFIPGIAYHSFGIASSLLAKGDIAQAEYYFKKAETIFREPLNQQMLYNVLKGLISLERKKGNYEIALSYYDEFFELEQAYHEHVKNRNTEELSIKHQVEQTKVENQFLQQELLFKQKNNEQKNLLVIALILLLLISTSALTTLIYSRKKIKEAHSTVKRQNKTIALKNSSLQNLITERDALVKTIIHDLKNPLSSIQGFSHLLEEENSKDERKLFLNMLNSSSHQLDLLIGSLLNAYNEEGKIDSKRFKEVQVDTILNAVLKGFQFDASYKNIELELSVDKIQTLSDGGLLYSVFGNLISNAIKFSPNQTKIFIELSKSGEVWRFIVRDQGPGFSESDIRNMYKMFTKLSAIPTNNERSTGIGLYSVKKAINRLGGEIELNKNYKEGAEFVCTFPFKAT